MIVQTNGKVTSVTLIATGDEVYLLRRILENTALHSIAIIQDDEVQMAQKLLNLLKKQRSSVSLSVSQDTKDEK